MAVNSVHLNFKLGYTFLSPGKEQKQYLLCTVNPEDQDLSEERSPIKLMLCLDTSGSMMGRPIELLTKTIEVLIDKLGPQDQIGIVTFSDKARLISEMRPMDSYGKAFFKGVLSTLQAIGSTNMSAGLNTAYRQLEEFLSSEKEGITHTILLSDGLPNRGETSSEALAQIVKDNLHLSSLSTFGFGKKHDEELLKILARTGNGSYTFIESAETIIYAFAKEVGSIMSIVGREVQLSILPAQGASVLQLINPLQMRFTSKGLTVSLPDLIAGYPIHLIFEMSVDVPDSFERGSLAYISLVYQIPDKISQEQSIHSEVPYYIRKAVLPQLDPEVSIRIALFQTAQQREQALSYADKEMFDEAIKLLRESLKRLDSLPEYGPILEEVREWKEQIKDEIDILASKGVYREVRKGVKSAISDPSGIFRTGNSSLLSLNTTQRNFLNKMMLKAIGIPHAYLKLEKVPSRSSYKVGQLFPVLGEISIGRNGDIKLNHPSIAKIHLRLIATPKGYIAINMPSVTPPLLDGKPITKPTHLKEDQLLQVGEFLFSFHLGLSPSIQLPGHSAG